MSPLILILTQIILLLLGLRVIFLILDQVINAYRRVRFSPNKNPIWIIKNIFQRRLRIKTYTKNTHNTYKNSRLWKQLLRKLNNENTTAERLINHLMIKHPGQSERWYLEKAIFDLERDKGRY
jgi:hypothetical protein